METIDIKTLEEALNVFYRSGSQQQSAAHEWLTKAQTSTQAWSFVWELLQLGKSSEVQFFGATTLHTKLTKHWLEVPAENRNELKQKLLETIILFGNGPKIVLNRLCIALSTFIVHMIGEYPTTIEDFVSMFHTQQIPNLTQDTQLSILLEVLAGIPEESQVMFSSVQRVAVRNEVCKRTQYVLNIVEQFIQSKVELELAENDLSIILRAVKCVDAWLKNGFPLEQCTAITNALLKVIKKCYWTNSNTDDGCMSGEENELAEASLKALTTILIQPDAHRYPNSALTLLNMIVESLSPITKAEWKLNNSNEDITFNIYTLLISAIECHSKLLIAGVLAESEQHGNLYMRLINEIVQCTDKPGIYPVEESCSVLSMGFWYLLQDEILSYDDASQRQKALELITPLYSHLTAILVKKAQQPDEHSIDKWNSDDLESFRCYRQDISDTLYVCYEVLHENLLNILMAMLDECVLSIQQDIHQWTRLEACVYAIYSIAEHIDTNEKKCLPKLISVLNGIPYTKLNEKLLGTALDLTGAYSEWFKDNSSYLPHAIQILVVGLNSTQTAQATLGLKDLCRECQIHMRPYAQPLLEACQQAIQNGRLINSDSVRLMYSIGKLMSILPPSNLLMWLDAVVSPCFAELQTIIQKQSTNESARVRTVFCMNMISTLFSSLNTKINDEDGSGNNKEIGTKTHAEIPSQPVLIVMQKTMPILKDVGALWIQEHSVVEVLCNALKFALTNLIDDFKPMLPDLCNLVVSILQSKCVSPAIDIAKTCIILFYKDEQCQQLMQQLLIQVIVYNLQLMEQTPDGKLSDNADVIESFYVFNSQIAKKLPRAFADTNIDSYKLITFALKAAMLPETGPSKHAVMFLQHFIMQSRALPNITAAILGKGEDIIQTTILCIAIYTLRTHVEIFAEIFVALNKKYPAELISWLKMLEIPNFPTTTVSAEDKEYFMKSIIREKVNKRLVQAHIREFSAKCRNILVKQ